MPTMTVVTPVYNGGHHYLLDTYQSLRSQELPTGWDWEWCVQEDGDTGIARDVLPADERISHGTGLSARAGVARTMALARATGVFVRALDADDMLLPGALRRDIETLHRVPWCTSAVVDLMPDGTTKPGPYDPEPGPIEQGRLYRENEQQRQSVNAMSLAAHVDLVWAVGGWMALTGAETDGLLLAVEAVAAGEFIGEPSFVYRKHESQTTASDRYWDSVEARSRQEAVRRRAAALAGTGWSYTADITSYT